mgnify:CR=1 FL=1
MPPTLSGRLSDTETSGALSGKPITFAVGVASVPMVGMAIGSGNVARARRVAWTGGALSLGIIGEYIGRIFAEVKRRPLYIVGKTVGFEPEAAKKPTKPV